MNDIFTYYKDEDVHVRYIVQRGMLYASLMYINGDHRS